MKLAGEGLLIGPDAPVSYAVEVSGPRGEFYTATCTGDRKVLTKAFMADQSYKLRLTGGEVIIVRLMRPDRNGFCGLYILSDLPGRDGQAG